MKCNNLKISVITPSLNQGEFIHETILSVLNQNYENFEHIIVDGGSTDNTLSVLKMYPHLRWVSESDKGQSDALNKGFQLAKGKWVLWLNADDILLPNALAIYMQNVVKFPDGDVFYGHMTFFEDGSGAVLKRQYFTNFFKWDIVFGVYVPPTTGTLFNKMVFLKVPLDIAFHYVMDAEWFLRCRNFLKVVRIDAFLVKFRISKTNKTSSHILHGYLNPAHKKEQDLMKEKQRAVFPKTPDFIFLILRFVLKQKNRFSKLKFYMGN